MVSGQSSLHLSVVTSRSGGTISRYVPVMVISSPPVWRQLNRNAPPGRRSISQPVIVQSAGPIQRGRCSGRVQASKTSRRGAANTLVTAISVSDGVLKVVASPIVTLLELGEVGVQPRVAGVPEPAEAVGPLGDLAQRGRLQ